MPKLTGEQCRNAVGCHQASVNQGDVARHIGVCRVTISRLWIRYNNTGSTRTEKELANTTWYKATQACRKRGEELYHSTDKSHVARFLNRNSGKHWIGAKVMYSSWTWTEDRSTLFKYEGYRNVTEEDRYAKIFLYRNQAVRCYTGCNTKYIGLQGPKCFCVRSPKLSPETTAQDRCWGNSQEYCGTAHGMSVYKVDLFEDDSVQWTFGLDDLCGYVNSIEVFIENIMYIKTEKLCQAKKYGHICTCKDPDECACKAYDTDTGDWSAANQSCSLLKIEHTIACNIEEEQPYWIGLSRYRYIGWVERDGSIDVPDTGRSGCVWAERLRNDTVVFGIKACHNNYKPLCTEDAISNKIPNTKTQPDGAVIGGSVAAAVVVILVLVLLAMIWMKRTKRVCFKDKSPDPGTRHVTSDDHNVESDYCEINDRPDQTEADSLVNRNGRQHYEFEPEAQLGVSGAKDEPYELAMDPRKVNEDGEGDYDELHDSSHNKGQQWSGAGT
ncbi:uncharacterized protein LOC121385107 [Gigantopelta aegis]|uniref:uncharacterized protein LOC121385107 n=1 Tax=Gigantopelta aegis TaxID=1735272 RepID=UPI001B88BFEE|nr:uncharacterized protein LOC121385107 [Gigantopelta aegis]